MIAYLSFNFLFYCTNPHLLLPFLFLVEWNDTGDGDTITMLLFIPGHNKGVLWLWLLNTNDKCKYVIKYKPKVKLLIMRYNCAVGI